MKVSIKNRTIKREGDVTTAFLTASIKMDQWWKLCPTSVIRWMFRNPKIDVSPDYGRERVIIIVQASTTKAVEDSDNPIIAGRIAESKVKMRLYWFINKLLTNIYKHYCKILVGSLEIVGKKHQGLYGDIYKYRHLYMCEREHLQKLLSEL